MKIIKDEKKAIKFLSNMIERKRSYIDTLKEDIKKKEDELYWLRYLYGMKS